MSVEPARRLGNGAVQGSWTGRMAPALRISPRLEAMVRKGMLKHDFSLDEHDRYRHIYRLAEDE